MIATTSAITKMITAHFQSPRIIGANGPKKNMVQEKPTGARRICPVLGFSKIAVSKATFFPLFIDSYRERSLI